MLCKAQVTLYHVSEATAGTFQILPEREARHAAMVFLLWVKVCVCSGMSMEDDGAADVAS